MTNNFKVIKTSRGKVSARKKERNRNGCELASELQTFYGAAAASKWPQNHHSLGADFNAILSHFPRWHPSN